MAVWLLQLVSVMVTLPGRTGMRRRCWFDAGYRFLHEPLHSVLTPHPMSLATELYWYWIFMETLQQLTSAAPVTTMNPAEGAWKV